MASRSLLALSRRDAVKIGAYAGMGVALSPYVLAASSGVITKAIPATGERIPVIGIGTNSFNEAGAETLGPVLTRFAALGSRMIDTAAGYGESEAVIGKLLEAGKLRSNVFLATKFNVGGMMGPPPGAAAPGGAPPGGGRGMGGPALAPEASFARSLERLKTDKVDLLYVHNINGTDAVMPQLLDWKKAGKIRYLGISTSNDAQHAQTVEFMKKHPLDFVQVNYGVGGRAAENTVLATAVERKIAIVANVPLGGRGGRNLQAVLGKPLPDFAGEIGVTSWAQLMLKYVVSHPAVTCVITGMTKLSHVEDNLQAGSGELPDAAMRRRIEQYWDTLA